MNADEYQAILEQVNLPGEVKLWPGVYITDVEQFIQSHLTELRFSKNQRQIDLLKMRLDRLLELVRDHQKD
ncbi:hypothetical protein [Pedobacter sp. FW305-3-2-15-E-R2A2]|uniref:DUF6965 family protein n=1 Tax=Pedobacter sp. FW305-3-2-15-E-R2A2 TaxID=3140251 RepID=UPI00314014CF